MIERLRNLRKSLSIAAMTVAEVAASHFRSHRHTSRSRWRLQFLDAASASLIGSSRHADDSDEEEEDEGTHLAAFYAYRNAHLGQFAHLSCV